MTMQEKYKAGDKVRTNPDSTLRFGMKLVTGVNEIGVIREVLPEIYKVQMNNGEIWYLKDRHIFPG